MMTLPLWVVSLKAAWLYQSSSALPAAGACALAPPVKARQAAAMTERRRKTM